jgi:riboflavin biosynthesis pyrimidine reductase
VLDNVWKELWLPASDLFTKPGAYDNVRFPVGKMDRPFTAITMVTTADGAIKPPSSEYPWIGGREDQRTYRRLRIHFDAVLRGARTVEINLDRNMMNPEILAARRDHGFNKPPLVCIVSNSGVVDPRGVIFQSRQYPFPPVLVVPSNVDISSDLERVAEVIRIGNDKIDLASVYSFLGTERGVKRILCEGGPTLNHAVIGEGLADEYLLTIAPQMFGEARPRTAVEGAAPYDAHNFPELCFLQSCVMGDHIFLRYRFRSSPFGGMR